MKKLRILIFEDEATIADALMFALETEGHRPKRVATAGEGLEIFQKEEFDLVVLDVGLPDVNGFEVCKQIRQESQIPIFFLTARSEEVDRIVGLEIGGDDYITKPFSPREVTARIRALFRRMDGVIRAENSDANEEFKYGPFLVNTKKYQISFCGRILDLGRYEYGLLKVLIENPGRVYSRGQLMDKVWDDPDMSLERTIDTHIKAIRKKLSDISEESNLILTHRGLGYSMKEIKN